MQSLQFKTGTKTFLKNCLRTRNCNYQMRFLFKSSYNCRQFGMVQRFEWQKKYRRNFSTTRRESQESDFRNGWRRDGKLENTIFPSTSHYSEKFDVSTLQRYLLAFGSSIMSIVSPERGDMIATMETHDFNHVLLQMPTTMLGEVTVKYFEAIQLGLPMCIAAAIFGGLRLGPKRQLLENNLPWIVEQALNGRFLLAIDWENRFEQKIEDLQNEFGIKPLNSFKKN